MTFDIAAQPWWRQAVVYQIYPRSFNDSNGDGLGDIAGITAKADYLRDLGADAAWLSPFYPSELADGGYDVADYRNVDPRLGTLEDFAEMVAALHERGIKVVVDIVPNHCSHQHEWFQAALAAEPGSPERDRFVIRRGKGENGELSPAADWKSTFGGPAWHPMGDGDWYFHHFAKEQPDLNWDNPEVREDFLRTLRFWSDRGVDGFRVDVANMLAKDLPADLPPWKEILELPQDGNHPLFDRDEVQEIYADWREVFNSYDPPRTAVAEAWIAPDRFPLYASPDSLGQAFNFDLLKADFMAADFKEIIARNIDLANQSGSSSTWVFSNHDVIRHASRYGLPYSKRVKKSLGNSPTPAAAQWLATGGAEPEMDRERGLRRAKAATLLMLALPGSAYLYQGEELGLHEVPDLAPEDRQDPTFFRTEGKTIGRDGCRVPLPWQAEANAFGFTEAEPHFPMPEWFAAVAADMQENDPESTLNLYRKALKARHELQTEESLTWLATDSDDVLAFERPNGWRSYTNFGTDPAPLPAGEVVLASAELPGDGTLPGETTVWLRD